MMFYDPTLMEIMSGLSDSDRKQCKTIIEEICGMADQARKDGLLSLEEKLNQEMPVFLWTGVRMITDGEEWENIERTLRNLLHASQLRNAEIVQRLIMVEGLRSIQSGENPSIIKVLLSAMLGEEEVKTALQ